MADFLVYDVPGRTDVPLQADDTAAAKALVESKLRAPANRRVEWRPCGGGEILTVRNARGHQLGSYWLRAAS